MKSLLYIGNKISHHGFSPGVIETLGRQLEEEGFRVSYAGTLNNQGLRLMQMLYKTVSAGRKADYILIDTYSTSAFWYAFLTGSLARLLGARYIPILHDGDLPLRLKRSKRSSGILFSNAFINVAVSGYLHEAFEEAGFKTITIPNSINIENYPYKERNSLKPALLWVRAFSGIYNPDMAIDVLAEIQRRYPSAQLCMVGPDKDGSLAHFIEYAGQKNVLDAIKITGKLSREEWIKLSAEYDFFINTTNIDNAPVSVIEAMALGLPVVTTNAGGIPFLLEKDKEARLVEKGDSKRMADAICFLLEHPAESLEMSRAARKKAEGFDWNVVRNKWIELLSN